MDTFDRFVVDFHDHFTREPDDRLYLGLLTGLGRLRDPSEAAEADATARATALLARIPELEAQAQDFDTRLDLELAGQQLRQQVHRASYRFNDRTRAQQLPTAGDDVGEGIFTMLITDPRPPEECLADITARLEQVPEYLAALLRRLERPLRRWVDIELAKVGGLPELFDTVEGFARAKGWPDAARLARARGAAEAALKDYAERLRGMPAEANLHLEERDPETIVRLRGIDLDFEALHQLARRFLADNRALIEELRVKLAAKYRLPADSDAARVHDFLNEHFRVELPTGQVTDILVQYQAERAKILSFIRERDLFPVLAEQDMLILKTPDFMEPSLPAGAMLPAPPFREGIHTSIIYLTLRPELMDEHTALSIPGMMIHEGIPGHHLQLATAATHPSVIRRHMGVADHAEGWTTMLEDYMLDQGYMGELTDEARFIGKHDINRLGARVAIDLFFMTGDKAFLDVGVDCDLASDDPFEAAGNLLRTITGFTPERTQGELNWYSVERGYPLCYLTGNHLVWALKDDLIAAQRGRLEPIEIDRLFHRTYLLSGNMPVSKLRSVFEHQGLLDPAR